MNKRVLVAFSSKHGATAGIASRIGAKLETAGLAVDVRDVGDVQDPAGYDAVVLGSAVYLGSWRREAATFAREHAVALSARPVWLFSSGPLAEPSLEEPKPLDELRAVLMPRGHRVFTGALDRAKLSFPERVVIAAVGSQMKKDLAGDWREWEGIDEWAGSIARELAAEPAEVS